MHHKKTATGLAVVTLAVSAMAKAQAPHDASIERWRAGVMETLRQEATASLQTKLAIAQADIMRVAAQRLQQDSEIAALGGDNASGCQPK